MNDVQLKLLSTNQLITLKALQKLRSGNRTKDFLVTDLNNNQYHLKTIKLHDTNKRKRREQLLAALTEAKALRTFGLLQAYHLDSPNNKVYLLLPNFQGKKIGHVIDGLITSKFNPQLYFGASKDEEIEIIKRTCFRELTQLHTKGLVHTHLAENDFTYDLDKKIRLVDLGLSHPSGTLACLLEAHSFLVNINLREEAITNPYEEYMNEDILWLICCFKSWIELPQFYLLDIFKYIQNNKLKATQTLLIYGALSIATLYGLGTFAATKFIATQLFKTIGYHELTLLLHSWSFSLTQLGYQKKEDGSKYKAQNLALWGGIFDILSVLVMGLNTTLNFNVKSWQSFGSHVPTLLHTLCQSDFTLWHQEAKNFPFFDMLMLISATFPIKDIYNYLSEKNDRYLRSEPKLDQMTDEAIYKTKGVYNLYHDWRNARSRSKSNNSIPKPNPLSQKSPKPRST